MRWDLLIIILALYNCVSIPFEVCYDSKFTTHVLLTIYEYFIDVLFFLDIIVNFRTTYINSKTGVEVTSGCKIAMKYIFYGRFWIDLAASIPLELFVEVIL